ncbi:MAG: hypothetical protein AAFY41_19925, partial [Bacteroidota bacterium]
MRTTLAEEEQIIGFDLQNIHDLDSEDLSNSTIPEEIVLSILANYPKHDAAQVISSIILRLKQLARNEDELRRYLQQLVVLSRLRKLEVLTRKQVEDMPITYDITTDGLYQQGIERGIEQGIERGIEQNKFEVISKALRQGVLTLEQIAEMLDVSVATVLGVKK